MVSCIAHGQCQAFKGTGTSKLVFLARFPHADSVVRVSFFSGDAKCLHNQKQTEVVPVFGSCSECQTTLTDLCPGNSLILFSLATIHCHNREFLILFALAVHFFHALLSPDSFLVCPVFTASGYFTLFNMPFGHFTVSL